MTALGRAYWSRTERNLLEWPPRSLELRIDRPISGGDERPIWIGTLQTKSDHLSQSQLPSDFHFPIQPQKLQAETEKNNRMKARMWPISGVS